MTRWQYKITKSLELDVQPQFNIYFVRNIYELFPYITQNAQRVDYQNQDILKILEEPRGKTGKKTQIN